MVAPERVEVAGDDDGLAGALHQLVQVAQLVVAMAELQRQVHQEHRDVFQLQLDDQPLDAGLEVGKRSPSTRGAARKAFACLRTIGTIWLMEVVPYLHS